MKSLFTKAYFSVLCKPKNKIHLKVLKRMGVWGKGKFFQEFSLPPQKNKIFLKKFARKKVNRLFFAYIFYATYF